MTPHGHDYTPCTHEVDSNYWQDRWYESSRMADRLSRDLSRLMREKVDLEQERDEARTRTVGWVTHAKETMARAGQAEDELSRLHQRHYSLEQEHEIAEQARDQAVQTARNALADHAEAHCMARLWKEVARRAIQTPARLARWEKDLIVDDFKVNGPVYTTGERDRHRARIEQLEASVKPAREFAALWKEVAREHIRRADDAIEWMIGTTSEVEMHKRERSATEIKLDAVRTERDMLLDDLRKAEDRAESAETEHEALKVALATHGHTAWVQRGTADDLRKAEKRAESIDEELIEAQIAQTMQRPHTTEVTDEMVERHRRFMWDEFEIDMEPSESAEALTAALTPEPPRPEGAGEVEAALYGIANPGEESELWQGVNLPMLADLLAQRGLRVTEEER